MLYTVLIKLKAYIMIYTAISIGPSYGNNIITTRERDLTSRTYYNKSNGRQNGRLLNFVNKIIFVLGTSRTVQIYRVGLYCKKNVCLFFYFFIFLVNQFL